MLDIQMTIPQEELDRLGLSNDEFLEMSKYALGKLEHPVTGEPIYLGSVRIALVAEGTEMSIG